ncbi:MAG: protein AmbC [Saprospiraceae bacterium]|nr:MAG: protein AmbC [Saprospiraceae bacterium]
MNTMNATANFAYVWRKEDTNTHSLPEFFKENYPEIKAKLLKHGAVLFKSFGIDDMDKLEACVNAFPGDPLDYVDGNSPRTKLQGKVYTSTEHPAEAYISLHNELSYASRWPKVIFFCCVTPALEGGNTSIADSRRILKDLSPEVANSFREKGVQYIRNLHGGVGPGPSWQDTFETEDMKEVENHCRANDIQFEWNGRDNLRLIQHRKAVIQHPETKEEVWFNQADQFHPSTNSEDIFEALMELYSDNLFALPQYACFSDGSEIPLSMLEEVRAVANKNTALFTWEKGDIMLVDNVLTAHGRTPFKGPRKILVSMSA